MTWLNKITMIDYTWLFVYESARSYEEGMHAIAPPEQVLELNYK